MFKPIRDQILVKPNPQSKTTRGGISIPDSVLKETPFTGKVVSVGTGYYSGGERVELEVKVNSNVVWMPYAGRELELDNEKYVLLKESDVLGIL